MGPQMVREQDVSDPWPGVAGIAGGSGSIYRMLRVWPGTAGVAGSSQAPVSGAIDLQVTLTLLAPYCQTHVRQALTLPGFFEAKPQPELFHIPISLPTRQVDEETWRPDAADPQATQEAPKARYRLALMEEGLESAPVFHSRGG